MTSLSERPSITSPVRGLRALTLSTLVVMCSTVAGVACGGDDGPPRVTVNIKEFLYDPEIVTVARGSTVVWTNRDREPHSATAYDGAFHTGLLEGGGKAAFTFDRAGEYRYYCTIHGLMQAFVVVTE